MQQSNPIVTYAPARKGAAPVAVRALDGRGQRRLGLTLAGALLAGGAVFALGTFVRPDGTIRDANVRLSPTPALAASKPAPAAAQAGPAAEAAAPAAMAISEADPRALPYLALVTEVAPSPAATPARSRTAARPARMLSAAAAANPAAGSRRASLHAASAAATGRVENLPREAELAPRPAPPPAGQRRDLEGFLSGQGLELAAPAPAGDSARPVSQWSPDDLAPIEEVAPSAAAAPATAFAAGNEAPAPVGPGIGEQAIVDAEASVASLAGGAEAAQAEAGSMTEVHPLPAEEQLAEVTTPAAAEAAPVRAMGGRSPLRLAAVALVPPPTPRSVTFTPAPAAAPVHIQRFPLAVVDGETLGAITLRDLGPQGTAIHLGALVGLLKLRMPRAEFERLSSAAAADRFVTLEELRGAGITVRLDERQERLLIEAR